MPLKRVTDPDTQIRLKPDGSAVDLDGVKFAVNPFDAIALEEALRIKEKIGDVEIVVVSIGGDECVEQLRVGLGDGRGSGVADQAPNGLDSLAIAKVLAAVYRREQPAFVLMGKQAIDDDSNQAGQMLAALLGIGPGDVRLQAGIGGQQHPGALRPRNRWRASKPSPSDFPRSSPRDLRLNEPRYVSLPGIMKAKKKPLEEMALADLGVTVVSRTQVLTLEPPAPRKAGVRVKTVDELRGETEERSKGDLKCPSALMVRPNFANSIRVNEHGKHISHRRTRRRPTEAGDVVRGCLCAPRSARKPAARFTSS